ncbi:unnamed protein product [Protopolystoma xenopodis]|uniref:TUP1-like enhancer of split domain-containing protein n=1 Tax=Protopolystoma xenopodis TaxID=117903 RepID=A0A448XI70_9PLAT|nr:unnamed protein product [Protopolystoma xenopodis]
MSAQTYRAQLFGSPSELRYWLTRWARELIEANDEEAVRRFFTRLIGPVLYPTSSSSSSWQADIKGISKRKLAEELLHLFALNLRLQRLYIELREMLSMVNM